MIELKVVLLDQRFKKKIENVSLLIKDSSPPVNKKWSIVLKIDCGNER